MGRVDRRKRGRASICLGSSKSTGEGAHPYCKRRSFATPRQWRSYEIDPKRENHCSGGEAVKVRSRGSGGDATRNPPSASSVMLPSATARAQRLVAGIPPKEKKCGVTPA